MVKVVVVVVVLTALFGVVKAVRTSEIRKKLLEIAAAQPIQPIHPIQPIQRPSHALRTETSPTFVMFQSYQDANCTICNEIEYVGTNICVLSTESFSSEQYLYSATSPTSGILYIQTYSDDACADPLPDPAQIDITSIGTCQTGSINSVSSTYSLPNETGYAYENFASADDCSAVIPFEATWWYLGGPFMDDAFFSQCHINDDDADDDVVFYRSTVMTPVTSPSTAPTAAPKNNDDSGNCFAGSETVLMESGEVKPISEIIRGNRVQAADANGQPKFSTVVAVPHTTNHKAAVFSHITAASGADVKMTQDHLLMVFPSCAGSSELLTASSVEVGMCVMTTRAGLDKVTSVRIVSGNGVYTIVTEEELIVVNGFVASPFAINHAAGHAFYNIVRMLPAPLLAIAVINRAIEIFGAMAASL